MAILMVDDDQELCALVREFLAPEGLELIGEADGAAGLRRILDTRYDLVVLDVMLPGLDGFEILRRARRRSDVPVILLTARGAPDDRLQGFDAGADDYLPKPFAPAELLARIRAILRRAGDGRKRQSRDLTAGSVRIVLEAREAWRGDRLLELTGTEFEILEILVRADGRIVARDEIFAALYQREASPFERSIDVHISHLRKKLGDNGERMLRTVRGVGYQFIEPR